MKIYIIISTLLCLALIACSKYAEYKPIVYKDTGRSLREPFFYEDSLADKDFLNILTVLESYKVDYKVEKGKIYINKKILANKELVWNYTNKSRDENWLNSNRNFYEKVKQLYGKE